MSCSVYVKDHAKIKRINITNSIFFRFFATELGLEIFSILSPNQTSQYHIQLKANYHAR